VSGAFKLKGQLKIRCFGDPADVIDVSSFVLAESDEDVEAGTVFGVADLIAGRKSELRATLTGVNDRNAAEALKGRWVFVAIDELAPTEDEEYYGYELIGCRVEGNDGAKIGEVRDIWSAGGSDLLVVADEQGAEHLIPMVGEFLREVDIAGRRIAITEIPGLLGEG
jgi:16S rRNA processing protein RimM